MTTVAPPSDFDFLVGRWRVKNRRLRERLAGCQQWEEFEASYDVTKIIAGFGNIGRYHAVLGECSIEGLSLRLYDPATHQWSIYWTDSRNPVLQSPLVGRFHGHFGEFFGNEVLNGCKIRTRFQWRHQPPNSARWEQAFSPNDGASWETNWTMEFTRTGRGE